MNTAAGDAALVDFPAADEVDGFWSQDRIHAPRPITPLAFDLITDTMSIGFCRAHEQVGAPFDLLTRQVRHYLYSSLRPPTDPEELAARAQRYTALPTVLDEVGELWEREWKPRLVASVRAGRVADYRQLTNADLALELDRQREHMIDQWTIHGRINFSVIAAARFVDFYDETFAPQDRSEAYQALQGFVTETVRVSHAMWWLSRTVRSSTTLAALFERPAVEVAAALREPSDDASVAEFAAELQAFLDEFGWRSDAVYDVASVTWREDPTIALDTLRAYVGLEDHHDPGLAFERAVERREALLVRARQRLSEDPETLATFDRYYEAAKHNLPLTEDHAFWIDQSGIANFRRFLLQVGERLAGDGLVDHHDDVFFLTRAEVTEALTAGGDRRAYVATRRASFAAASSVSAPPTLGVPRPPAEGKLDPLLDAFANRLAGRRPPQEFDALATTLTGHAASPGVATGTARVVRNLAEAAKLADGEILVCEMTLPPWVPLFAVAAAVVADTGGLMSHTAIVAREFELPAVVGTQFGTSLISDGMTVTVDGDRGEVRLVRETA